MAPAATKANNGGVKVAQKQEPQEVQKAELVEKNGHMFHKQAPHPKEGTTNYDILTGDHGLEEKADLKDFIWTLTNEPHAERRKEMLKELGTDVTKLTGPEPLTKYIVALMLAIHIGIGYSLREEALGGGSLKFWVVAYVFGATLAQILFLANHEISHNLAFKSQTYNKILGVITNMPMLVPYFIAFKDYHNEHHKLQGTDGVDTDLPTELEARLLSSTPGRLFYMFNQTWFYAFRPVFIKPQPFTPWHGINLVVQIIFISTIYNLWGMGPIWYFLASAHFAGSWHPLASHFIAEHYTFVGEAETCSYYGWMNWLTWNVGYHNEHHDFPYVPWSRLPALKRVGAKWYDKIPYHESWVLALWNFMFNPHITFYNRVKRMPASSKKDE